MTKIPEKEDILDVQEEQKKDQPILTEKEDSENVVILNNPRQIICLVEESVIDKDDLEDVIEQIDGNTESIVTYDQTISAETSIAERDDTNEDIRVKDVEDIEEDDIDEIATKINAFLIKEKINSSPGDIFLQKSTPFYKLYKFECEIKQ